MLTTGAVGVLTAVAIFLTTVLAARGDAHLSGISVLHAPIYLASIIVSGAMFVFSGSMFTIGVHVRKVCSLVRFVADGPRAAQLAN
jgi:hypothetical protein